MNNKELYIEVMSGIQPSEDVIERIFDMTEIKKRFRPKKSLIAVLVVFAILAFGGVTANAATDGAVAEYISNTVKVLVNGKNVNANVTDGDNGEKHIVIDADVQDGANEIVIKDEESKNEDVIKYDIQFEDNGVAWSKDGNATIKANNFQEPTTSVQN